MFNEYFNPSNQILICDDLQTVRKVLRKQLGELGISDIVEAENGAQALARIKEGGIGLVLSDWHMPEMSGLELLKALRGEGEQKKVPVILITSVRDRESVINAAQSGVDAFIVKPFTKEILADKMQSALDKKEE